MITVKTPKPSKTLQSFKSATSSLLTATVLTLPVFIGPAGPSGVGAGPAVGVAEAIAVVRPDTLINGWLGPPEMACEANTKSSHVGVALSFLAVLLYSYNSSHGVLKH